MSIEEEFVGFLKILAKDGILFFQYDLYPNSNNLLLSISLNCRALTSLATVNIE